VSNIDGFESIPIISLSNFDAGRTPVDLAESLRTTCHQVGFFVIVDHGIEQSLFDDVFALMRRFFSLPEETKALIDKRASPHFRGWEAVGSEFTNNRVDVREQIDFWTEWPSNDDVNGPIHERLLGPNQWMPTEVLPGQRELTVRWMRELGRLADRLLELLAVGLGLDASHFRAMFGERPMSLTKMISYPPTPPGGAGVNAHHDTGFLTLLAPGPVAGLQVLNPAGEWIDVPTIAGSLVANLGEMLQAMTGNYFVATTHRVVTAEPRMSVGYFHGPSLDTELVPLELAPAFAGAVAASPRHATAGFMASIEETTAGAGDMESTHRASTYGEQLWNYFRRSYPANMAHHHPDALD
jgi:isopenicillin N synthase-like dioxygenase